MITSIKLVTRNAAVGAKLALIGLFPVDEFLFVRSTLLAWVGELTTLETDAGTTFTLCCFIEHASLFDIAIAARFRTPLQIGVQIHVNVQLELQEFLVDFFRAKLAHIVACKSHWASNHHAGYLHDVSIFDVVLQVFFHALLTIVVLAFKAEESCLVVFFVTNITGAHYARRLRSLVFFSIRNQKRLAGTPRLVSSLGVLSS